MKCSKSLENKKILLTNQKIESENQKGGLKLALQDCFAAQLQKRPIYFLWIISKLGKSQEGRKFKSRISFWTLRPT